MKMRSSLLIAGLVMYLTACNSFNPEPIKLNVDNCEHCKMTVADLRFAAELITEKGRVYKFDDIDCLISYKNEKSLNNAAYFIADYDNPQTFLKAEVHHKNY